MDASSTRRADTLLLVGAAMAAEGIPTGDLKAKPVTREGVIYEDAITPEMMIDAKGIIDGKKALARAGKYEKLSDEYVQEWKPILRRTDLRPPPTEVVPPIKEL